MYRRKDETTTWLCISYYNLKGKRCKAKLSTHGTHATLIGHHIHPKQIDSDEYKDFYSEDVVVSRESNKMNTSDTTK